MSTARDWLRDPRLEAAGFAHGFGMRESPALPRARRPRQVHGARVARLGADPDAELGEADAVLSCVPDLPVAVVTADCVPLLLAEERSGAVAAVHAGWRGLAEGVIEAATESLRRAATRLLAEAEAGSPGTPVPEPRLRAAIGPCIGVCCYEVDTPVLDALRARVEAFEPGVAGLERFSRPTRRGHARIDLAGLASAALHSSGLPPQTVSVLGDACTRCDALRFHSYRRDGSRAGRLLHWISARSLAS